MHAFVYALEFQGTASIPPETPFWSVFLRYTIVGYAVALLMSLYMLWTFGRTEGLAFYSNYIDFSRARVSGRCRRRRGKADT